MKKAQGGVNAAILVAIIAALIIIYILFLPTEEVSKLLGENETGSGSGEEEKDVILLEHPYTMEYLSKDEIEHSLPSINLYTKTEDTVLKSIASLYVKNAWFDKKAIMINFSLKDIENVDFVQLSFEAKKRGGRLIVELNGHEIYNSEISSLIVEPILLSKEFLLKNNVLVVSVSGVGMAFWKRNEYTLENLKLIGRIADITTKGSDITILISESEERNLEEAKLRFFADCTASEAGKLSIRVNNHEIINSVPDCGSAILLDFSPYYLVAGENHLVFSAEKGEYLIDQVMLKTKLKESPSYTYYFELSEEQFDDIQKEKKDLNLTFRFSDEDYKEAEIIMNGRKFYMPRHKELAYSKVISSYAEKGTNALKIIPKTTMEVFELKIELA